MKKRDDDDPRFLPCARKLHQKGFSKATIQNVIATGSFGKEDLAGHEGDKIMRRLDDYYLPMVQYTDAVQKKNLFNGDKTSDLDAAAKELANEPRPHKQFRFTSYCHVMGNTGKYQITAEELQKHLKNFKRRQNRTAGKRKQAPGFQDGRASKKLAMIATPKSNQSSFIHQSHSAGFPIMRTSHFQRDVASTAMVARPPVSPFVPARKMMWEGTPMTNNAPNQAMSQEPIKSLPPRPLKDNAINAKLHPEDVPSEPFPFTTPKNLINAALNPSQSLSAQKGHNLFEHRLNECVGCHRGPLTQLGFFLSQYNRAFYLKGTDPNNLVARNEETGALELCHNGIAFRFEENESGETELVVRGQNCKRVVKYWDDAGDTSLADGSVWKRCSRCANCVDKVSKMFTRFAAHDYNTTSKFTPLVHIAVHPKLSLEHMRAQAATIRALRRRKCARLVEKDGCAAKGTKEAALKEAMAFVKDHFAKQQKNGSMSEKDQKRYELMSAMYDNLGDAMMNGGKRSRGTRFSPTVITYCVQMCIKVGWSKYQILADAFGWPSISTVHKLKKARAGSTKMSWDGFCMEAVNSLQAVADKEGWGPNERLLCTAHDSTLVKAGVMTDFNNNLCNLDISLQFDPIEQKFDEMAEKLLDDGDDAEVEDLGGKLEEHMTNVAKHHMIVMATRVSPKFEKSHSLIVGVLNLAELGAGTLSSWLDQIIVRLYTAGFDVISNVGDGASENCAMWENWSRVPIASVIPKELQDKFPDINFHSKKIGCRPHPVHGRLIIMAEDMPHLVKRICHNAENSSISEKKRNLRFGHDLPANFLMIWYIYSALVKGNKFGLIDSKLTKEHFNKNPMSRMKVRLAVQMFSVSTERMVGCAVNEKTDSEFEKMCCGLKKEQYQFLRKLLLHVNRFVDIINGIGKDKTKNPFTPENGREIQEELLGFLDFFSKWKKHNDAIEELDEFNFLAEATWRGIERTVFGYVAMIQVWCIEKKFSIVPRRTTSDCCEHHFARARVSFGSTDSGTAYDFDIVARNQQSLVYFATSSKTNCSS